MTSITNRHKLSGLRQEELIILQLWRSEAPSGPYGARVEAPAGLRLLEAPRENPLPCLLQLLQHACVLR